MTILVHPAIEDLTLTNVLYGLGDATRLKIVQNLYKAKKPLTCLEAVKNIDNLPVSSRSNCFQILRQAGLIRSERQGRECYNTVRYKELENKFPKVLSSVLRQPI